MDTQTERKRTHVGLRLTGALTYAYLAAQMFTGVESFSSDAVGRPYAGPGAYRPNLVPSASFDAITWVPVGNAVWVGIALTALLVFLHPRLGAFAAMGMAADLRSHVAFYAIWEPIPSSILIG